MVIMRTALATALVVLAFGCAANSRAQTGSSPAQTGGPVRLVLRTMTSGGIAGLGGPGSQPDFSLYADGTAISRNLTEYHLTPQAYKRLVRSADDAGLATPRTIDNPRMADALYTVITFVTGGRARTTKVIQGSGGPVADFLSRLDPGSWPPSDLATAPHPYRPALVAVLATPAEGTGPAWPYSSLASGTRVGTRTCTVLPAGKAARTAAQPLWRDHGQTFRVSVRPLLPDETSCFALTR
jgi:hypothetical protein